MQGERGAGGLYATWEKGAEDPAAVPHIEFQFANMAHQEEAAMSGMWLFLATELLFFGGLFLLYAILRGEHPAGTAAASRLANLAVGTINTVILLSSSAVFSYGLGCARSGRNRGVFWCSVATALLGCLFLGLKGYEWSDDFAKHLFPGADFGAGGPDAGAMQLFWCFYFIATGLHGLHMIVGVGLVAWIAVMARRGEYSAAYSTPVEAVGLYWSFVDMVWLVLYPCIYLAGSATR